VLVGLGLSLLQRLEDFRHKTGYDQTLRLLDQPDKKPHHQRTCHSKQKAMCIPSSSRGIVDFLPEILQISENSAVLLVLPLQR
jgi:hypothetical protein